MRLIITAVLMLAVFAAVAECPTTAELAELTTGLEVTELPDGLNATAGRPLTDSPEWAALAERLPDAVILTTEEPCHGCRSRRIWIVIPGCSIGLTRIQHWD